MGSMNRRKFIKSSTLACATVALLPNQLPAQTEKATASAGTETAKTKGVKGGPTPEYAKEMLTTDMQGLGPDGKPIGPEMLAPVFPMNLIEQEVCTDRWIDIPDGVLELLARYRRFVGYRIADVFLYPGRSRM